MSKTRRGGKAPGFEYWGKRALSMVSPGRVTKQLTARIERARAKKLDKAERD